MFFVQFWINLTNFVIRIIAGPEILPFSFPDEVEEGQLLQVICTVTKGDDPVTLQWYKDDTPVTSSSKFLINSVTSRMSLLVLSDVGMEHSGKYSCIVFNPVGQMERSAILRVKGNNGRRFFFILICEILSDGFLWAIAIRKNSENFD